MRRNLQKAFMLSGTSPCPVVDTAKITNDSEGNLAYRVISRKNGAGLQGMMLDDERKKAQHEWTDEVVDVGGIEEDQPYHTRPIHTPSS